MNNLLGRFLCAVGRHDGEVLPTPPGCMGGLFRPRACKRNCGWSSPAFPYPEAPPMPRLVGVQPSRPWPRGTGEDSPLRLVLIRGLPGSGKSTRAKTDYSEFLHYEPDHLFCDTYGRYRYDHQLWAEACHWILRLVDGALARGESVVVSDVFCKETDIAPYRELAKEHGATITVITCEGNHGNAHRVPLWVYRKMQDEFEEITQ